MRIENGCILCSDGFRNALLHFQNLHARLNKRGLEPPDLVRNLGRRDPVPRDVIQVIAHDMDLAAGHSGRNACSFKPDFLTLAAAHAPARLKQMSNNARASSWTLRRQRRPESFRVVAPRRPYSSLKPALIKASSSSIALSASGPSQRM